MTEKREQKFRQVAENRQRDVILVLEDIQDPHNVAAVSRSADAFGIQNIHIVFESRQPYDPNELSMTTSSSASKWIDFHTHQGTEPCLAKLKRQGFTIIGTALHEESESIYEFDFTNAGKVAILLGNESRGLTKQALGMCDHIVLIPMRGVVESMNLSVTAGICMFEVTRQRCAAGIQNFLVDQEHAAGLLQDFAKR